ncbi:MAG: ABC transporter ATP-binding protein [Dehalococcoidia bacterium]
MSSLLEVRNLRVQFQSERGVVKAVDGISYDLEEGETLGLVGESGCGKTVSALSIMRLVPSPPGEIVGGQVLFEGQDLLQLSEAEMRRVRGNRIGMIFQEPGTSLNPVLSIGRQLAETIELHTGMGKRAVQSRAVELLEMVGIPDPERRLNNYPHQFSGGMRQRVLVAMGLSCNPRLLLADEPTTALDVTIQAQILELIKDLSAQMGIAVVLITHNLGIVARYADRVNVMYAGKIVERGTARELYSDPRHPYTRGLLHSMPRLDVARSDRLQAIEGMPPQLDDMPPGCSFIPRCPYVFPRCSDVPMLLPVDGEGDHLAACWMSRELGRADPSQ